MNHGLGAGQTKLHEEFLTRSIRIHSLVLDIRAGTLERLTEHAQRFGLQRVQEDSFQLSTSTQRDSPLARFCLTQNLR